MSFVVLYKYWHKARLSSFWKYVKTVDFKLLLAFIPKIIMLHQATLPVPSAGYLEV